jgi:hypothetical protein
MGIILINEDRGLKLVFLNSVGHIMLKSAADLSVRLIAALALMVPLFSFPENALSEEINITEKAGDHARKNNKSEKSAVDKSGTQEKRQRIKSDSDGAENNIEVYDVLPAKEEKVSMAKVLALDLIVPGGGHYYLNNYYMGVTFGLLKVGCIYSIYYFYQDWKYRKSLYHSAKKANETLDPDHSLYFKDPDGGYTTDAGLKRGYDRAVQKITFSAIATAVVYMTSLFINYVNVSKINEKGMPSFEIQHAFIGPDRIESISVAYNYRF